MTPTTPKSICILRLSAIGDVCNAVAAVQAIQRHYPQCQITWIIGRVEHSLLKGLPGIRFVVFDKSQGWRAYSELKANLKDQHFDYLLHMQVSLRANLASLVINARIKVGFDKARSKEFHGLFMHQRILPRDGFHVLDGFMQFSEFLGVPKAPPHWEIPIALSDKNWVKKHLDPNRKHFVICPAASKAERNWLPERYAQISDWMNEQGFQVILCGSKAKLERDLAEQIQSHAQSPLTNLVGQSSLKQLLALLAEVDLVLAPDTGPLHMSVAVNTPVVGLYVHSHPARTGPYLYQDLVVERYQDVIKQQTGRESSQLEWGARAKGKGLMHLIDVSSVKKSISKIINGD